MIPVLTVIFLVIAALFGAVMLSKRHTTKEVDVFECGPKPFSNNDTIHCVNVFPAMLFIIIDAVIILFITISCYISVQWGTIFALMAPPTIGIICLYRRLIRS